MVYYYKAFVEQYKTPTLHIKKGSVPPIEQSPDGTYPDQHVLNNRPLIPGVNGFHASRDVESVFGFYDKWASRVFIIEPIDPGDVVVSKHDDSIVCMRSFRIVRPCDGKIDSYCFKDGRLYCYDDLAADAPERKELYQDGYRRKAWTNFLLDGKLRLRR